jgi:hypothetical protein
MVWWIWPIILIVISPLKLIFGKDDLGSVFWAALWFIVCWVLAIGIVIGKLLF